MITQERNDRVELNAPRLAQGEPKNLENAPRLIEISSCLKDMTEAPSFFSFSVSGGITPRFAKEVSKLFHLGSWPLLRASNDGCLLRKSIECYCAIAPHGQIHVAEVFFADDEGYLGTHMAFTLQYPSGQYDDCHDGELMSAIAEKVFGFERETKT